MCKEVYSGEIMRAALVLIDEDYEPPYLECTHCYAIYDPDTPGINDWCFCPSCGFALTRVDSVDWGAAIDGQEYLAHLQAERAEQLTPMELRTFVIGGSGNGRA